MSDPGRPLDLLQPQNADKIAIKIADLGNACWVVSKHMCCRCFCPLGVKGTCFCPVLSTNTSLRTSRRVSTARWRSWSAPTTAHLPTSGAPPVWWVSFSSAVPIIHLVCVRSGCSCVARMVQMIFIECSFGFHVFRLLNWPQGTICSTPKQGPLSPVKKVGV